MRPLARKYIAHCKLAKKLVKIYFNGSTVEKALKLDWVSQAFLWDESEQVADTNEFDHCTRTGRPGRVRTPDQLVRSGFDHRFPVTPDPFAVMACDQSIIGHYSRIIGIIAKYHITVLFRGINRPLLGFPLCL